MKHDEANTSGHGAALLLDGPAGDGDAAQRRVDIFALLRGRYHWAILLALLLGGGAAAAVYYNFKLEYRGAAQIHVAPELQSITDNHSNTITKYESFLEFQANRVKSGQVIEEALRHEAWRRVGGGNSRQDFNDFRRAIDVEVPRNQQILVVYFHDEVAAVAGAGAEALAGAYQQVYGREHSREDANRLSGLERRRSELAARISRHRQTQQQIAQDFGIGGLSQRYEMKQAELVQVESIIRGIESQIQTLEQTDENAPSPLLDMTIPEIAMVDPVMRELLRRKQDYQNIIDRGTSLNYGENHRSIRHARADIDNIDREIEAYARTYRAGATAGMFQMQPDAMNPAMPATPGMLPGGTTSLERLKAQLGELTQYRQILDNEVRDLGRRTQQIADLEEEIEVTKQDELRTAAEIDRMNYARPESERIGVDVSVPTEPYNKQKRIQFAGAAGMAGAGLGVGLVMLLGMFDRRFRHVDDAHTNLPSTRMLGILPTLPENLTDPERVAIAAHCVHHIRTMLQLSHASDNENGKVLAITSPAPGSGKTSLSTALGLSFASSDARTLLIDCDIVGAGLTRRLGTIARRPIAEVIRHEKMLSDEQIETARQAADASGRDLEAVLLEQGLLSDDQLDHVRSLQQASAVGLLEACDGAPLNACIADTGINNLSLLPVGAAQPHQAGNLSPSALRRLIAQVRSRYDVVLIDTGPILGSIEASMATAEADGVVLVVSRGDQKSTVFKSLDNLRSINARVAGIVFNHASADDVQRSSYASVASGPSRPGDHHRGLEVLDPEISARFGPVGSAVASTTRASKRAAPPRNGHANGHTNGHTNGTGKD